MFNFFNKAFESPKGILYILISKYVLYYNGAYFFDIIISKSGPILVCSIYFNFEIYFVP